VTTTECEDLLAPLNLLCRQKGFDWGAKLDVAAECAWAAEVRVTIKPNVPLRPDRSYVTFAAGGEDASDALARAVDEMCILLDELGLMKS